MQILNNSKQTINSTNVALAVGDGIGPEIMDVVMRILQKSGARLKFEFVELGEKLYQKGYETGISEDAISVILRNKILLKGPITTPQGGGFKSINVTLRKMLGLYANVRPCKSYHPFVKTNFPNLDVIIIRENEEDLYAGIEYKQTQDSVTCIKLITRSGCEKIIRYAFEYVRKNNRKKLTCMTKDNIMKMTDGLFRSVFNEISSEYPEIQTDHYIIDIGTARLAANPEIFDTIVTLNLYGDIISDVVAEVTGSVGLAGSSNIGKDYAMFEAIHGSAPTIVGQGLANPSALINSAVQMLAYIGQGSIAKIIEDALLYTIESGFHTHDIFKDGGYSKKKLSTSEFGDAVIDNFGKIPASLTSNFQYEDFDFDSKPTKKMLGIAEASKYEHSSKIELFNISGVDLFVKFCGNGEEIGHLAEKIASKSDFKLLEISAKGIKIYPSEIAKYTVGDFWRIRLLKDSGSKNDILDLISLFYEEEGLDVISTQNLYDIYGKKSYSISQG